MLTLLSRFFIKNYKDYSDSSVRSQYGVLCGGVGIFLNLLLFAGKFIFGTLAASVAMIADAFNNLSDASSSLIQILGFKLSEKKPDPEHPFGHGRMEYITGLIISFLVLLMGVELFKSSVETILHPRQMELSTFSIVVMIAAVLVKLYMMFYNLSISKKINSVAMKATATDSFFDAISTSIVLISFGISRFTLLPVDGIAGIVVSLFILYGGYSSAKETISPLLGDPASREFVEQVEKEVRKFPEIVGIHDFVMHDYGPGRKMISLHAEVPGDRNIFELHDVIDLVEATLALKFKCQAVIHMDPIDTKNERLAELKKILNAQLEQIHPELKSHDVRMIPGPTHTNLIFDVVKPFELKMTDYELITLIQQKVNNECNDVYCAVTVDQPFVS